MAGKALIVEDEQDTGNLLAEILRQRGFDPTVLAEGKPAIPWTRRHRPELILLDLMLPDIPGFQVCEDLKLDRDTNPIPIIMVTALTEYQDRIHGLQVGANYYLTKPFTVEQLHHAIADVLAWKAGLQQHGTQGEIHFRFQSDTHYLEEFNHFLSSLFLFTRLTRTQIEQLTTAVRELCINAIEWGHQKQIDRLVNAIYRIDPEKVTIIIRDEGPGFDPTKLPHAAKPDDPVSHAMVRETLGLRQGGFGILLARGLVDEMEYNDTGNEVRLVKHFAEPPGSEPTATNGTK